MEESLGLDKPIMDDDLPEDYMSPRSKVARMLADIDEAPTPSPDKQVSPSQGQSHLRRQIDSRIDTEQNAEDDLLQSTATTGHDDTIEDAEDEEEDSIPIRPAGRVARRMQNHGVRATGNGHPSLSDGHSESSEDEDLYSATPLKSRTVRQHSVVSNEPASTSRPSNGNSLFVSPSKSISIVGSDSDDNLPSFGRGSKLADLVAAKRRERLAKEANAKRTRPSDNFSVAGSPAHMSSDFPQGTLEVDEDVAQNDAVEKILSDAARPSRKASKKALLDMERETQRLARQQALAHQIKVKKNFSTSDLFARFNFRQGAKDAQPVLASTSSAHSSAPASDSADAEQMLAVPREPVSTPPSSPPTPWDKQKAMVDRGALAKMVPVREYSLTSLAGGAIDEEEDLPDLVDILRTSQSTKRAIPFGTSIVNPVNAREKNSLNSLGAHERQLNTSTHDGSDDDLDIIQPMPSHLRVFDRVKPGNKNSERHSKAIHMLKHLAQLTHDDSGPSRKKKSRPSIPPQILNAQLLQQAKTQAHQAQLERIAELKAKGVVVMSAEERDREAEQTENLLEKARLDVLELRKKERAAAKHNGNDETHMAASDDEDEDEDWEGSQPESEAEDGDDSASDSSQQNLVDDAAEESEVEDDDEDEDEVLETRYEATEGPDDVHSKLGQTEPPPGTSAVVSTPMARGVRKARKSYIVIDEEEDEEPQQAIEDQGLAVSNLQDDSEDPFAAFGFGSTRPAVDLMSPTQAFNATMQTPTQMTQGYGAGGLRLDRFSDSSDNIIPPPTFAMPETHTASHETESQSQLIPTSQIAQQTQEVRLDWETQMPETPVPGLARAGSGLLETPGWEPSQDAGLPSPWTLARRTQMEADDQEHDTQSTVYLRISESPEAPVMRKKGRLTKGPRVFAESESEDDVQPVKIRSKKPVDAFAEMQKRRLETLNAAERAEAEKEMRKMMDDQAEESEDEYADLGGDDTNMIAPETAEDREIIDESHVDVNERELAQLFAERQRAAEEEATSKLFKDITTGALRRRQGAGWELDEDEDEVFARRRQMKQREEARKRRLLLQDESIKGLVEGKGNTTGREAFLRAMVDDDVAFEDDADTDSVEGTQDESQSTQNGQDVALGPLREVSGNKRRLEHSESDSSQLPAKSRRRRDDDAAFSRPTSLIQLRESLSILLDEPSQPIFEPTALEPSSDNEAEINSAGSQSEDDDNDIDGELSRQNDGGFAPNPVSFEERMMPPPPLPADRLPAAQRRTPAKATVVDRLSLKRTGSSSSSSSSSMSRSAWTITSGAGSKAPSLLRRATNNLSAAGNANERGVSFSNGASNANERGVSIGGAGRSTGNKKSSLAAQARAEERKAIVERAERKKAEGRKKIAEIRRMQGGALVGGSLGSGKWE